MNDAIDDLAPYSGRWVALVAGAVAGVGATPAAAQRAAQRSRRREKVELRYVDPPGGRPLAPPPVLAEVVAALHWLDAPVHLVGGAVRDLLLNRPAHDFDFVLPSQAIKTAFRVGDQLGWPAYVLDRERDTGRVVRPADGFTLDFARYRGADLRADLRDRDFAINAMALPLGATTTASLIDPGGGQADLAAGRLHLTHPGALLADPIRVLRAVRQAQQFGLALPPATTAAVKAAAPHLAAVTIERQRDELLRLLGLPQPAPALQLLVELGILGVLAPDLAGLAGVTQSPPHHEAVLAHTISVLRWLSPVMATLRGTAPAALADLDWPAALTGYGPALARHWDRPVDGGLTGALVLRLGALLHDVGKGATRTEEDGRIRFVGHEGAGAALAAAWLTDLRLSNAAVDLVRRIVANHMRPLSLALGDKVTPRAVYRFFKAAEPAGVDVLALSLADHLATYDGAGPAGAWEDLTAVVAQCLQDYFDRPDVVVRPAPLLDGHELMAALDLEPGPLVGELLRAIEEAQAAGEVTTPAEAIALARAHRRAV